MLRPVFSNRLVLKNINLTIWPYLTLSVSYEPNQGFELAVPTLRTGNLWYFKYEEEPHLA